MARHTIKPGNTLVIDIYGNNQGIIPMIVVTPELDILSMCHATGVGKHHIIRKNVITLTNMLISQYNIDTILLEQNKLFIDKIDRHPDPFVLSNVLIGYGIKVAIEDNYYDTVKYILQIPEKDWRKKVLNPSVTYAIDLYKSHVESLQLPTNTLETIDKDNYYKSVCFSESILFRDLMHDKYQINKGD